MLAKAAIERGNNAHAQALPGEVLDGLTDIRDVIGKAREKTVDETRVEIMAFADTLDASTPGSDFAATIDHWWDRIGELMVQ